MRHQLRRPARTRATGSACPSAGTWDEVLNTDAESYTGSGVGNLGSVTAVEGEHAGLPAYADIRGPAAGHRLVPPARLSHRVARELSSPLTRSAAQPSSAGPDRSTE